MVEGVCLSKKKTACNISQCDWSTNVCSSDLPLVSLLLTRMGLITPEFLSRSRRYAIVIIFVTAAILTPPDVITQIMLAGPLIVLFEVSILVSRVARPRKKAGDTGAEENDADDQPEKEGQEPNGNGGADGDKDGDEDDK